MSTVSWLLELTVNDAAAGKALAEEMSQATKADEPGALIYEYFLSDDEKTLHIYERYADSEAVLAHMANFGEKFADRFLSVFEPTSLTIYGSPDDAVKKTMAGLSPAYLGQVAGFAR